MCFDTPWLNAYKDFKIKLEIRLTDLNELFLIGCDQISNLCYKLL